MSKTTILANLEPKNQATDRKFNDALVAAIGDMYDEIMDAVSDRFKNGGEETATNIAAIATPETNIMYRVSEGGDLNSGGDAITTIVGDLVYYDGTIWKFLYSGS